MINVDIMDYFCEEVEKVCDAPKQVIETVAYWLIADTIGTMVRMTTLPNHPPPSFFAAISGLSGLTRKSTAMSYAEYVSKQVWEKFMEKELKKTTGSLDYRYINEFSVEGICDHVQAFDDYFSSFSINNDEFGKWLNRAKRMKYISDMKGFFSQLKSAKSFFQPLSLRGGNKEPRYMPGKVFNICSALQDMTESLEKEDITQGFVRRFIWIVIKREDKTKRLPLNNPYQKKIYKELDKIADLIYDKMAYINSFGLEFLTIQFTRDIYEPIEKICEDEEEKSLEEEEILSGPASSIGEHIYTLLVLNKLSRYFEVENNSIIMVKEPEILNKTLEFWTPVWKRMMEAFREVVYEKEEQKVKTDKPTFQKILSKIRANDGSYAVGTLQQEMNKTIPELEPYITSLIYDGRVEVIMAKWGTKNRFILYTDKDKMQNDLKNNKYKDAKKIDSSTFKVCYSG